MGFRNDEMGDRREEDIHGQGNRGGGGWRFKRLDLPVFEGPNPDGWILRAERFFKFYGLNEDEKLEAAVVALDGDALF